MKLRSKLILAFLLLSVVPLSLVTFYSYRSSVKALRQAVEQEAASMAGEMGRRMEVVTTELGRRIEQLWDAPEAVQAIEAARMATPPGAETTGHIAKLLGDTAMLLDKVEIVPAPPLPPPPPSAPLPPRHADLVPAPPPPPKQSSESAPVVIDVEALVQEIKKEVAGAEGDPTRAEAAAWVEIIGRQVAQGLEVGRQAGVVGLRVGAQQLAAEAERHRARTEARRMMIERGQVGVDVEAEGKVVGTLNARLNLERVLGTVLALSNREQGEIPFAIDNDRRLYTPRREDRGALERLGLADEARRSDLPPVISNDDWIVVTRKDDSGVVFGLARPVADSLQEIRRASLRNLAIGLGFIGLALIGIIPLSSGMTRHLTSVADGANRLARGDFGVRVPVESNDEIGQLARSFNQMASDLESHQKLVVEQERLHRELELCRRIQTDMLPRAPLRVGLTEVKGISIPAREVGGDFFNYFVLPDGDLALVVGDVSGKGVSAALLMANIQATLRARLSLEHDLAKMVDVVDREVDDSTPGGVYVTLFVGVLETRRRVLRYVNAGHNPQFILRASGAIEPMSSMGLPIGLFAGHGHEQCEVTLDDGDQLFFYTDGMVETENESGELFGAERLEAVLVAEHEAGVDALLDRVEGAVRAFRGKAEPLDDATMMALRLG